MDEKTFDRVEKKYIISSANKKELLKVIKKNMKKDKFHKSGVFNIYFDNDNYDFIIQSIDHPVFKEKLRVRSYYGYDKAFFEIKTKMLGKDYNVGYKRRVLVTHKDYNDFVKKKADFIEIAERRIETKNDLQIAREIDYFIKQYNLKPKILVYYNRESYKGDNNLRITFDTNLKYRNSNLKFTKNKKDKLALKKGDIIMEIKASGSYPMWLVQALSKEHTYPQRFSKIGKIYELLRKEQNV